MLSNKSFESILFIIFEEFLRLFDNVMFLQRLYSYHFAFVLSLTHKFIKHRYYDNNQA